jgi:hypothetical protein
MLRPEIAERVRAPQLQGHAVIDLPLRERVWTVEPIAAVDLGALAIGDMAMTACPSRRADRPGIVRLERARRAVRIGELPVGRERTGGSSDDGRQRNGTASLPPRPVFPSRHPGPIHAGVIDRRERFAWAQRAAKTGTIRAARDAK